MRSHCFKLTVAGPVENVWNSPNGLSVQTFDIYIDQDGPERGARLLLPGRNAALSETFGWDYAIWVEGWTPGIYVPGAEGPEEIDVDWTVLVDPGQSKVTVKVPKELLGDDPASWSYAVVVLGQEGYPATGVWRVRDVEATAKQWRFGGRTRGYQPHPHRRPGLARGRQPQSVRDSRHLSLFPGDEP